MNASQIKKLADGRSEEHTSELQSPCNLVCRLLLEKKKQTSYVFFVQGAHQLIDVRLGYGPIDIYNRFSGETEYAICIAHAVALISLARSHSRSIACS